MGWDNPPVPWQEFQRRLSWETPARQQAGSGQAEEPRPVTHLPAARRGIPAGQCPAWAELHCHSSYSFLDGASAPAELVAEAAHRGLTALAITDHDGMYGVPQFVQAAARLEEQAPGQAPRRRQDRQTCRVDQGTPSPPRINAKLRPWGATKMVLLFASRWSP